MKYDIGIQTFWNVPNYGTFVQAYALQKVLKKLNGNKDVRQISHLDQHHFNFYFNKKAYMRKNPIWKKTFWRSFFIKEKDEDQREKNFLNAYSIIPHTEVINKENIKTFQFNKIFLGSDIIWDYSISVFNNDPMLFGIGFNAEINSYAASFGTISINDKMPEYVKEALKKMKYISVRDEKSAEIVKKITGKTPIVVLDPTWLWNFNDDSNIVKPEDENYILVYGQDFTHEFIKNLIAYAKKKKKKIIALDCNEDHYDWCDKMISQSELSPFQWVSYFKYAEAIATSTFHGITFSLIFNKKFAFCKSDFIMAKIDKFLKEINLYDLYNKDKNDVNSMLEYDFKYPEINEVIEKKRKKSIEFLRKACNLENE